MAELNHTGAFATVTPATMNVADMMFDKQKMDLLNRKEERELAQQEEEIRKEKDKRLQEIAKYNAKFKPYDTENISLNTSIVSALSDVKEKSLELWNVANDRKRTDEERSRAWMQLNDLQNYPEKLKLVTDQITDPFVAYKKAVENGTSWPNRKVEEKFHQGYKGMKIMMDDNMNPTTVFIDRNGDGISDIINFDEVKKLSPDTFIIPKINYGTTINEASENLGYTKTVNPDTGYKTVTKKSVTDADIRQYAGRLLFDNGAYSPLVVSRAIELEEDWENITPDVFNKIKDNLINDIRSQTDRVDETTVDLGAKNAADNLNYRKQQGRKEEEKNIITTQDIVQTAAPIATKNLKPENKFYGIPDGSIPYTIQKNTLVVNSGKGKESVESFYLTPDGNVVVTGNREVGKRTVKDDAGVTTSKPIIEKFKISSKDKSDEVGLFATKILDPETGDYLKDSNDLKGWLKRNLRSDKQAASSSNKISTGEVIDGYKFLGGDPNNPKSWKKI